MHSVVGLERIRVALGRPEPRAPNEFLLLLRVARPLLQVLHELLLRPEYEGLARTIGAITRERQVCTTLRPTTIIIVVTTKGSEPLRHPLKNTTNIRVDAAVYHFP